MPAPQYKTVPLAAEEKDWLMKIYNTRRRYLGVAFLGYTLILIFVSFSRVGFIVEAYINELTLGGKETWLVDQHFTSGWAIKILLSAIIAAIFCLMSFVFRIRPYKQDADSDIKYSVPYTVFRKGYVPISNQYFITLENFEHSFEVDPATYDNSIEGGQIFMGQAIRTGYIFSDGESFEKFTF